MPDDDDHITPVMYSVARRYGIRLDWFVEEEEKEVPADFSWSSSWHAGFSFKERYVYAADADASDVLHEMVHLILGPSSMVLDEGYLLMPFEWQLAQWMARRMDRDGPWFLRLIKGYQDITLVGTRRKGGDFREIRDFGEGVRQTRWWRRGTDRAHRLRLLDADNNPTFKRPQWIGSGVAPRASWWDPDRDDHYR